MEAGRPQRACLLSYDDEELSIPKHYFRSREIDMWVRNRMTRVLSILAALLCCEVPFNMAQQSSSAAPSGNAAQTGANPSQTTPAKGVPSEQSPSASDGNAITRASQTGAAPKKTESPAGSDQDDVPEVPGFQTRVLKAGEKVPERENKLYEDWSKPELTPGMKWDVVPLGTADGDGFTRQLLTAQWREMDPIDLWIIKPKGIKNPPVILYLYSSNGSNSQYKNDDVCKFLAKDGFAAVGFVSAITEQRFHDRPLRETFVSQLQEGLGSTVHDVQMILNYLQKRGDFDMQRVGMWGDGSGASIAIMAAAVDPRIKTLDLLDPWGDWPDWLAQSSLVPEERRSLFLTPGFLGTVEDLEPMKALAKLTTQKVRLQYITEGVTVTPAAARQKMEAAAPQNVQIVHYDTLKRFSEIASKGVELNWIKNEVALSPLAEDESTRKASLTNKTSEQ